MLKLLLAFNLLFTPVIAEADAGDVVTELIEETQNNENEVVEVEEDEDVEFYKALISELTAKLESYKNMISNEAVKTAIGGIITFLASLGALYIRARKFDVGAMTLDKSKVLMEEAEKEFKALTKDMASLGEDLKKTNLDQKTMLETFTKAFNTLNKAVIRVNDRLTEIEKKLEKEETVEVDEVKED